MVAMLVLAVLGMVCGLSDAAWARDVRRGLAEAPARWLGRMSAGRWAAFLLVGAVIVGVAVWLQGEGLAFLGPFAGEVIAALAAIDVGAAVEVVALVVLTAAAGVRLGRLAVRARRWLGRRIGAGRPAARRRARRGRGTGARPPSGEGDDWPGLAWA